jgi:hypothetical protein
LKKRFFPRLDPQVYDLLKQWAADELRSVNGQIEYLLLQALRKAGRRSRAKETTGVCGTAHPHRATATGPSAERGQDSGTPQACPVYSCRRACSRPR